MSCPCQYDPIYIQEPYKYKQDAFISTSSWILASIGVEEQAEVKGVW